MKIISNIHQCNMNPRPQCSPPSKTKLAVKHAVTDLSTLKIEFVFWNKPNISSDRMCGFYPANHQTTYSLLIHSLEFRNGTTTTSTLRLHLQNGSVRKASLCPPIFFLERRSLSPWILPMAATKFPRILNFFHEWLAICFLRRLYVLYQPSHKCVTETYS